MKNIFGKKIQISVGSLLLAVLVLIIGLVAGIWGYGTYHNTVHTRSIAAQQLGWSELGNTSDNTLQIAIADQWPSGCIADSDLPQARLSVRKPVLRAGKYVKTPLSCLDQQGNDATDVFVETAGGAWEYIGNLQLPYGCEKISLYNVPKQIAGSVCRDKHNVQHNIQ